MFRRKWPDCRMLWPPALRKRYVMSHSSLRNRLCPCSLITTLLLFNIAFLWREGLGVLALLLSCANSTSFFLPRAHKEADLGALQQTYAAENTRLKQSLQGSIMVKIFFFVFCLRQATLAEPFESYFSSEYCFKTTSFWGMEVVVLKQIAARRYHPTAWQSYSCSKSLQTIIMLRHDRHDQSAHNQIIP